MTTKEITLEILTGIMCLLSTVALILLFWVLL